MGCLELFLSEVSSGVLAPLEDGLALRPVPRLFYTFSSALSFLCSSTPSLFLSDTHFPSLCREREREGARESDCMAPKE